ncbi:hypothetical protein [Lentibacillus sp. CBA3610]|uniref:hypothetical protein n=1 Tax=Lentibacillus sp. CBA3610 TaxID=2518176 RepID=UPI00350E43B2
MKKATRCDGFEGFIDGEALKAEKVKISTGKRLSQFIPVLRRIVEKLSGEETKIKCYIP